MRLRVFGYASIVFAVLFPVSLFLLPRLILAILQAQPRRYHYYYVSSESNASWIPIASISATLFLIGILLIALDRKRRPSEQD